MSLDTVAAILNDGGSLAEMLACAHDVEAALPTLKALVREKLIVLRDKIENVLKKIDDESTRQDGRRREWNGERTPEAQCLAACAAPVLTEDHPHSDVHTEAPATLTTARRRRRRARPPRPPVAEDPVLIDKRRDGVGFLVLNPSFRSDWTIPIPIHPSARRLTMAEIDKDDNFLHKCAEAKKKGTNLVFHRTRLRQVLLGKIHPTLPNGLRIGIPPPLGTRQCDWDCVLGKKRR